MIRLAISALVALAPVPLAAQEPPPEATLLWTIGSDDCASMHADGEPWTLCGFQAFAMNPEGTRVLTISWSGAVQLWNGEGRELRRIDWPDDPSGATGYPSARLAIVGTVGVAAVHHNQLLILDLADGRTLHQRVVGEVMTFRGLRADGTGRLLAELSNRDWDSGVYELALPDGGLRPVSGIDSLFLEPPRVWLTGERAPFAVHDLRPEGAAGAALWACAPVAERFCFRRDLPGRFLHYVDLREREAGGRSVDIGRELGQFDGIWFAVAGDRPYAVICGRSPDPYPPRNPCHIRDLADNRAIYAFTASNLRVEGGLDGQDRPELRLTISQEPGEREQRRVSPRGEVRIIEGGGRANLAPPGGGLILPETETTSILLGRDGRPLARLPFHAQMCGSGWPDWQGSCRISQDGRHWLVPIPVPAETADRGQDVTRSGLALYDVPSGTR